MRRVVVTGMGIVSSIGNNTQEVTASLREAKSGIVAASVYRDMGFRSQVEGAVKIDLDAMIDHYLELAETTGSPTYQRLVGLLKAKRANQRIQPFELGRALHQAMLDT